MSISEMQACLARLYVDDSFRKLFYLDKSSVLSEYRLTENESTAIKQIDQCMLDLFAESLKQKRMKRMERAYSSMFALNRSEVTRYYRRYYELYRPSIDRTVPEDVLEFGRFLEDSLSRADNLPPYASELIRFERLSYEARFGHISNSSSSDGDGNRQEVLELENCPNAYPLLSKAVRIEQFNYDVAEIEHLLLKGEPLQAENLGTNVNYVIFLSSLDDTQLRFFRVTLPVKFLLERCDGHYSVSQLIEEVEQSLKAKNLQRIIMDSLKRLITLRIIDINMVAR
jgi:hypothetical protein